MTATAASPFAFEAPLNPLSLGSVSIALLRELFRRGESPAVFPIMGTNPDLSAQVVDPIFEQRLQVAIMTAHHRYNRRAPAFRSWHIGSSIGSLSVRGNHLLTYMELDQLTPSEINVLKQQEKVYVSSRFTQKVFSEYGVASTYIPLGFDGHNFRQLTQRPKIDGAISFLLPGKIEKRKGSMQVLRAWAKRYGNNPAYRLNCAMHNHFVPPEKQGAMIAEALEGRQYWNIVFHPWIPDNATYNSLLQSSEIVISMSGGEGRDLPCYHATAMGAWPVAMRAHAYLDYLNDENAVLVNPNGKQPAADGIHFGQNGPFNNGNIFTFNDEEFIAGCEAAEQKVKTVGLNTAGMELQKTTYTEAVDIILADLKSASGSN